MSKPYYQPIPHAPKEPVCNNPKFFEIFGSPCDNLTDFLLDDAKRNYCAKIMNDEQKRNDDRFNELIK